MSSYRDLCAVTAASGYGAQAQELASRLQLDYLEKPPEMAAFPCLLHFDEQGLGLQLTGPKAPGAVRCDFVGGALQHRRKYGGGKKQDLPRSVGLDKRPGLQLLDLTAGLGRDSFVLASLGANVTMVERNPVVHALLADGLARARQYAMEQDQELLAIIERMSLRAGSATEVLTSFDEAEQPDVIFLDPMFPERQKSAKVKKEMQAFHVLVGGDEDADQLLAPAREAARYRVVVKRPSHAPVLAEEQPNYALTGKSTRFDIYTNRKI